MRGLCNVQVITWVPQNDVLAHPNLRTFLSHAGINSMYEVRCHLLKLQTLQAHPCAIFTSTASVATPGMLLILGTELPAQDACN